MLDVINKLLKTKSLLTPPKIHLLFTEILGHRNFCTEAFLQKFLYSIVQKISVKSRWINLKLPCYISQVNFPVNNFKFSLKVMWSNPGYLLDSFLLYKNPQKFDEIPPVFLWQCRKLGEILYHFCGHFSKGVTHKLRWQKI